ncbi:hypothetical protein ENUP19_0273G0019 [Entamoeba nuttalli]|uniref:Zinc finger domain containing protein n=2 Tax=Entamoeba nuttalli TaxID=412467 RepID=K2H2X7_ENTNP|nr:zinc finger domain containing protein [Entamoeba nuttalli P19]EKE40707.1 zinc finger domain containing protein [Entamoeba nuttalli P19]|eukprot:XP_008856957.1 zinc finger domain containing protein [Entamoeba nuttalli P19]
MEFDKIIPQITCAICLSNISECCVTKCGHAFCKKCLDDALNFNEKCPYCSSILRKGEYYRFYQFDSLVSFIDESRKEMDLKQTLHQKGCSKENGLIKKQLINIKSVINEETKMERNELVNVPCDLEKVVENDLLLEENRFIVTVKSNHLPMILKSNIESINIQINSKVKEQKRCIRDRFIKGMTETFYHCFDCDVKFICSSCAEICHSKHHIEPQLTISCMNAVCYCCRSPNKCQLTN